MKNLLLLLVVSVCFLGCENATEILPIDDIDATNAFLNINDLETGISGAYSLYSPQNLILFSSRFTDDLQVGDDSGGQGRNLFAQQLNASTGGSTAIWDNHYELINFTNRILDAVESISVESDEEQSRLNRVIAECYGLRALAHFDLLSYFSTGYDQDDLGIPFVDFVVIFELPLRNTVGENLSSIQSDIEQAEMFISDLSTDAIRINADMLSALKSKIAIYTGNNNVALSEANKLIDKYPLANKEEYLEIFTDDSNTEVIFKARRTQADFFTGGLFYFTGTGGAFFEMSEELFGVIGAKENDVRRDVLVEEVIITEDEEERYLIGKYPGVAGFEYLNDVKVFRVSEQYLIRSEAQAKIGNLTEAAQTLKTLRDARTGEDTPTDNYSNLRDAIVAILAERRVELAYEGHRYLDLKRTRSITNEGITRIDADCGGDLSCGIEVDDFRFTLPIPQVERDANPDITQNPGYVN